MIFVFLDEFGHNGPYFSRSHPRHNTSPVFGLAGYLMPESSVRNFGSFFINRKRDLLNEEITRSGKHAYEWEKKGTNYFTANSIRKYPKVRSGMFRMLNEIKSTNGKLFYYGREKRRETEEVNPNGLYKTIFAHAIRQLDAYCNSINQNFVIVMDENSVRRELLETAAKTMFGAEPIKRLLSPPFEVESHLNQNIQAADWIATIVGRLWNFRLDPEGFGDYAAYETYFWQRVHNNTTHSTVMKRPRQKIAASSPSLGSLGLRLLEAQNSKQLIVSKPEQ